MEREDTEGRGTHRYHHPHSHRWAHCTIDAACEWINGQYSLAQKHRGRIGQVQKTLHPCWKRNIANPILKIDDFVKHVHREHKQEADHWANIGAQGQRKMVLDRCDNSETWKAVKGYLDWQLQRQWHKCMWCGDQRSRQEPMCDK